MAESWLEEFARECRKVVESVPVVGPYCNLEDKSVKDLTIVGSVNPELARKLKDQKAVTAQLQEAFSAFTHPREDQGFGRDRHGCT